MFAVPVTWLCLTGVFYYFGVFCDGHLVGDILRTAMFAGVWTCLPPYLLGLVLEARERDDK